MSSHNLADILTAREEEVVWHIAAGLSNREIAARLQLSENTIANYEFRIFEKLGISGRVEAVLYASSCMQEARNESPQPGAPPEKIQN